MAENPDDSDIVTIGLDELRRDWPRIEKRLSQGTVYLLRSHKRSVAWLMPASADSLVPLSGAALREIGTRLAVFSCGQPGQDRAS